MEWTRGRFPVLSKVKKILAFFAMVKTIFLISGLPDKEGEPLRKETEVEILKEKAIIWDLSAFNPKIVVEHDYERVQWILGFYSLFKPKLIWINPEGNVIENDSKFSVSKEIF